MTGLAIFLFGNNEARTITNRPYDGDHWYMAADICGLLGITNHSLAVHNNLDNDEWRKKSIYIGGHGKKKVLLISTIGMLKLIVKGRTPYSLQVYERLLNVPANLRTPDWPEIIMEDE